MVLSFVWDEALGGYVSDVMEIDSDVIVRLVLSRLAPVVTLKETDDGWANFGQTPDTSDRYEITLHPTEPMRVRIATPVAVIDCETIFF